MSAIVTFRCWSCWCRKVLSDARDRVDLLFSLRLEEQLVQGINPLPAGDHAPGAAAHIGVSGHR